MLAETERLVLLDENDDDDDGAEISCDRANTRWFEPERIVAGGDGGTTEKAEARARPDTKTGITA